MKKDLFKTMNRKKGVIFSYIFMVAEALSSILYTPFVIRCLGQDEYGVFGLVATVTAYLHLLDLGVGNAIVRYMVKYRVAKDRRNEQNVLAVTMIFYIIIGVVVIALGQILTHNVPNLFGEGLTPAQQIIAQKMMKIMVLTAAATLVFAPVNKTLIAYEHFALSKVIDIFKLIVKTGLGIVVLLWGGKGVAVVTVNLIAIILAGLVSLVFVFAKIKLYPKLSKLEKGFLSSILSYSSLILLQMVATQIAAMMGQSLIGIFVASSAGIMALYTIGTQITTYFQSFGMAINGVLMPGITKMVENKADKISIQNEMIKVSRLQFAFLGVIFVGFVVCGKEFMLLWAGEGYERSYPVAIITMIPMLFYLTQYVGTQVLWAMNKHKFQSIAKIIVVTLNIGLTILFIKITPLIGAALGMGTALLFGDVVVMNIAFKKDAGISLIAYWKGMFKGILPCLILSGIVGFLVSFIKLPSVLGMGVQLLAVVGVYGITMLAFGMNTYEKQLLSKIPIVKNLIRIK